MNYTKATLQGTLEAVLNDIKNIEYKGDKVYPNYPEGYEVMGDGVLDRFIVTSPRQEVITPATYNDQGEEITPAVLGDWKSKLVLPSGFDVSIFKTKI